MDMFIAWSDCEDQLASAEKAKNGKQVKTNEKDDVKTEEGGDTEGDEPERER